MHEDTSPQSSVDKKDDIEVVDPSKKTASRDEIEILPDRDEDHRHEEIIHHHSKPGSLAILGLIIASVIGFAVYFDVTDTVVVVGAIVAMVMIHELGHFITAKLTGMKATEYFLGFGPKLWSFTWGETEYGIKAIPAGGYVKIVGMTNLDEIPAEEEHRTYRAQSYWKKMVVTSAGVITHFVMAFILLMVLYAGLGLSQPSTTVAYTAGLAGGPSPAQQAGIQAGDRILSINGTATNTWEDVQRAIGVAAGQESTFVLDRNGDQLSLNVTPISGEGQVSNGQSLPAGGFIGISPQGEFTTMPFGEALGASGTQMVDSTKMVFTTLQERFSPSGLASWVQSVRDARGDGAERTAAEASGQPAPVTATSEDEGRFVSPLGIWNFADQAADQGIRPVIALLFSVNLFIGIFNLIPLLPFDGGHMAIATYEKLRSLRGKLHRVDFNKVAPLSYAVLLAMAFFGLSALWLDVWYPARLE